MAGPWAGPWAGRLTIIMNNMKIALAINHRHSINKDQSRDW